MIAEILGHEFNNYEISTTQKEQLCRKRSFNDKIDCLIIGLKGNGLMNPKLRSLTKETRVL